MRHSIQFVLVRPRNPGNIGAIARVMKNLNFNRLALVSPETELGKEARNWACGADDVLDSAQIFESLSDAVARSRFVVGTTARRRTRTPAAIPLDRFAETTAQRAGPVSLVFGPERTGLTAEELGLCHAAVHIPTKSDFRSLNLVQAVALLAWELRRPGEKGLKIPVDRGKDRRATAGQLERMFAQAEESLLNIDFLRPGQTLGSMITLRAILDRAVLTPQDVRFLRGIFRQINNLANRNKNEDDS